jgi:hypothetical protein
MARLQVGQKSWLASRASKSLLLRGGIVGFGRYYHRGGWLGRSKGGVYSNIMRPSVGIGASVRDGLIQAPPPPGWSRPATRSSSSVRCETANRLWMRRFHEQL